MAMNGEKIRKGVNTDDMGEYYTIEKVQEILPYSKSQLYRFLKSGLIKAVKVAGSGKGGKWLVEKKAIDLWAKQNAYKPTLVPAS